ncbi:MAG: leucyl aminopeptidase, partial [Chloroflexi bacterium]|nr:leucyl aminopeptidase [Chloroflexota bacterium]
METRAVVGDITRMDVSAIMVNLFEGVQQPGEGTGAVDRALGGVISSLIGDGEIKGKRGELTLIHTMGRLPARRVLVVGLGKQKEFNADVVRGVTAEACRYLRGKGVERAATIAHGAGVGGLAAEEAGQAIAEGALLGLYAFKKYRSKGEDGEKELKELLVVEADNGKVVPLQRGIDLGTILAGAVSLARDMVNEPANQMTPTRMAEVAHQIAEEHGLGLTVLEKAQCEELGMGAFLSVAKGSVEPPKFIVLKYSGDPGNSDNNLGLVGKGITFDSGGISIKSAQGMEEMKGDMAGGASVMAAVKALAQLRPRINVTAIVAATENLPSGSANKPGDVVRAMNGKTIEVINTDAEGRVTLADAIPYARQIGLKRLVDVATLTGAIVVALGDLRVGLFSNNQELADRVLRASKTAGERLWQ